MKRVSRADLLRVLNIEKELNIALDKNEVAQLFRFKYQQDRLSLSTETTVKVADVDSSSAEIQLPNLYTESKAYRYWYVAEWQMQRDETTAEEISEPSLSTTEIQPLDKRAPFPTPSLLSAGQWQNLWDQYLTHPNTEQGIDVPLAVKQLSQGEAVHDLPRIKHQRWNKSVVLILDRCTALCPLWPDMRDAWLSLLALIGKEQLQTFFLPDGPAGRWARPDMQSDSDINDLAEGATVMMLGAFGALSTGGLSNDWRILLNQLQAKNHPVVMLSVRKIQHPNAQCHVLSPNTESSLDKLLTALALAWKPSLNQLRHLRMAISGATVLDELLAYNHKEVDRLGLMLNLKPEVLPKRLRLLESLPELDKLRECAQQWQGSLSKTAQDIERLQYHLFKPSNPDDYQALQCMAYRAQTNLKHGQEIGMGYSLMRSMLPLYQLLAEGESADNWQEILHVAQKISMAEGLALPLKSQGLKSTGALMALRQIDHLLVLDENHSQGLLQLGEQAYCVQTKKIINQTLETDYKELQIIDQGQAWTLRSLQPPDWSDRFWQDEQGLFATHCENALFFLHPASVDNPTAQWICRYNPWSWAGAAGIDEKGLWADLQVKDVGYRMRWIKAGQFKMGSPEQEEGRYDGETQHLVTLTQGYWLGETSCTQAFWLSVMGDNPSDFKESLQLPVETISWNDCQEFISRLLALHPSFPAQLPTEAQWEYACRAGTKTAYWWGDNVDKKQANYGGKQTKEEKQYPVNDFGLKSMSGNVYEWCADWKGQYPTSEVEDPTGTLTGPFRVLRGGCWISSGRLLRSAFRNANGPGNRSHSMGFRLAGGLDPQASQQAYTASRGPWSGQAGGSNEQVESKKIQGESE